MVDRFYTLLWVLVGAMFFCGCFHSGPGPLTPGALASLTALITLLKKELGWWFDEGDIPASEIGELGIGRRHRLRMIIDRHKGFFAFRRAMVHGVEHPEWFNEGDLGSLRSRIKEEITEVDAFVQTQFTGPKSLSLPAPDGPSGAGPTAPFQVAPGAHIDIQDVSRIYTNRAPQRDKQARFQRFREDSARSIIWRAAAIHGGFDGTLLAADHWSLWDNTKPAGQRLNRIELKSILDRRLRTAERMRFQISENRRTGPRRDPGAGATGPWSDFVRVQIFQYPFLGLSQEHLITPVNPTQWIRQQDEVQWGLQPVVGDPTRIPTKLHPEPASPSTDWVPPNGSPYVRNFSGANLATSMDALMESHLDYFRRGWLYCDHVCCVLHLDALRFGLRRKNGDDEQFKRIPATPSNAGVPNTKASRLTAMLGEVQTDPNRPNTFDENSLLRDGHAGAATWFENRFIPIHQLQVADHTIFFNHYVYVALWSGAFRLENAIVTAVESNPWPEKGGIEHLKIELEGHGMAPRDVAGFQSDMLDSVNEAGTERAGGLPRARRDAVRAVSEGLDAYINWRGFVVLRWDPYPGITSAPDVAGPWFLFLPRVDEDFARWPNVPRMLEAVAYSVAGDPTPSAGYRGNPPTTKQVRRLVQPGDPTPPLETRSLADGVLFPLYLPTTGTGTITWREYFALRRSDPTLQVTLRKYEAPPDVIPGFFIGGRSSLPAQVIRPKGQV